MTGLSCQDEPDRPAADSPAAAEAETYRLFERLRWPDGPQECPHCFVVGRCYYLRPVNAVDRSTRTGRRSARRVWKCGACRRQFSVLTGTVFEGTKIPLTSWTRLLARCAGDGQPDTGWISRNAGVGPETARHLRAVLDAALDAVSRDDAAGQPQG